MRSLILSPDTNEALLSHSWTRLEETGEFIHLVKAFLTLLATIQGKHPWSRLPTGNPVTGMSLTEKIFKSLQCAETIAADSLVEPIKLRMARVLLYHQYEQKLIELRHNSSSSTHLSSGKGLASIAKSVILERIYGSQYQNLTAQAKRKRENSLKWHTRIGKRWSYVTSQLGVGIILTCSHILEIHM
ncbi:hypothetical protein J3E72DRAFT_234146 [Bipolaris maydis]|nr:hypothetical protein J3E72DRAFT_234146 [Bipolaris maydis]